MGPLQLVSPWQLVASVFSSGPYQLPRRSIEGLSLCGCEGHAMGPLQLVSPWQLVATVFSSGPYLRPRRSIEGLSLSGCEGHAMGRYNWCRRGNWWRRCFRQDRTSCRGDQLRVCPFAVARVMRWGRDNRCRRGNLRRGSTSGIDKFQNWIPAAEQVRSGLTGTDTCGLNRHVCGCTVLVFTLLTFCFPVPLRVR
jgi:hypothetical protein